MEKKGEITEQAATIAHEVLRVNLRRGSVDSVRDEVVMESRLELYVNDERYAVFLLSPSEIEELVVGHLLAEGITDRLEEIERLEISKGRANVYLTKKNIFTLSNKFRLIGTECGSGAGIIPPHLWMKVKGVKDNPVGRFNPKTAIRSVEALNSLAMVFRRTGGTHASVLLDENGRVLAFSEDIGRHNAVDKVVGQAALKSLDLRKMVLASTGRLTSEMVIKAANVGIEVIVSTSAPTDKGIKVAEATGLTLIGFARGKRFNIYTHPERVQRPEVQPITTP